MEYAARLTKVPSVVTPLVTLLVGAAVATGAYALIDDSGTDTATKTIVVEQPGPSAADIPGKNESATAAAISGSSAITEIPGKDEASTAAAISQSNGVELRGSKASSTNTVPPSGIVSEPQGIPSPAAAQQLESQAEQLRSDPHGPAISLRNP
jgi:hypothetical protein